MDWASFLLGMLGAFVIVYLVKQQAIPEFRAFYDTSDDEKDVIKFRKLIDESTKMRNSVKSHTKTEHAAQRRGERAGKDIVTQVFGIVRIGERSFRWLSPRS